MPDQPLDVADFSLDLLPFQRVDHLAAEHGTLRRLEFHHDVEPVEDLTASRLTALFSFVALPAISPEKFDCFMTVWLEPYVGECVSNQVSFLTASASADAASANADRKGKPAHAGALEH
jgi:hypothetical protein